MVSLHVMVADSAVRLVGRALCLWNALEVAPCTTSGDACRTTKRQRLTRIEMARPVRILADLGLVTALLLELHDEPLLGRRARRPPLERLLVCALHQIEQRLVRRGVDLAEASKAGQQRTVQALESSKLILQLVHELLRSLKRHGQRVDLQRAREPWHFVGVTSLLTRCSKSQLQLLWR
eukprot:3187392-Prymnesium_polylepis.2